VTFAIQNPGKLWEIDGSRALVVCGTGTLGLKMPAIRTDRHFCSSICGRVS
jgi:hypothetical protein